MATDHLKQPSGVRQFWSLLDRAGRERTTVRRVKGRELVGTGEVPRANRLHFEECTFEGASFDGIVFRETVFERCRFINSDLYNVVFEECKFIACQFKTCQNIHVNFRDVQISACEFGDVDLEATLLVGAKFNDVVWTRGSIVQACFDYCAFTGTSFSEAVVHATFRECAIGPSTFDYVVKSDSHIDLVETRAQEDANDKNEVGHDPLVDYLVRPQDVKVHQLHELDELLKSETDEAKFQAFLAGNRELLAVTQELGHHGTYVLPQVALGNKHRADFMIGYKNSMGCFWVGLEIESPKHKVVKKDGHLTAVVQHAIDQVNDWRAYVRHHRTSVQQVRSQGGEGLTQIEPEFQAWVIIGRDGDEKTQNARRDAYVRSHGNTHIQTWDGFRSRISNAIKRLGRA